MTWSRDEKRGIPTLKTTYFTLLEDSICLESKWWNKQIWKGIMSLKIKCFLWLSLENKLITQDNFQRRGGIIVNCCFLCVVDYELVDHFLFLFPFTITIWWKVLDILKIKDIWGKSDFSNIYL